MKKLNVLIVLAIAMAFTSCAQNKSDQKPPQAIVSSFNKKFPNAKNVDWDKENEKEWEAEFKWNSVKYSANFSNTGEWLETEYKIKNSEIPTNIKTILDANFKDYDIETSEVSETTEGKFYEFEIEVGEQEFEVTIDQNGNLTKKLVEDDETDED